MYPTVPFQRHCPCRALILPCPSLRDSLRAPERDALKAAERLKGADHDRAGPLPGRPRPIKSVPDLHQRGFPVEATQVLRRAKLRELLVLESIIAVCYDFSEACYFAALLRSA